MVNTYYSSIEYTHPLSPENIQELTTILHSSLGNLLIDYSELQEIKKYLLLRNGVNKTFKLNTSNNTYILKLYPSQKEILPKLEKQIKLLKYLNSQGINVNLPIGNINGNYINQFSSIDYAFIVFSYFDGGFDNNNPLHASLIGEEIGKLHKIIPDENIISSPIDIQRELKKFGKLLNLIEDKDKYEDILSELSEKLENKNLSILHGDLNLSNFKIINDSYAGLYDFDLSSLGNQNYDLGTFISKAYRLHHLINWDLGNIGNIISNFLQGYEKTKGSPIANDQLKDIYLRGIFRQIWELNRLTKNNLGNIQEIRKALELLDGYLAYYKK